MVNQFAKKMSSRTQTSEAERSKAEQKKISQIHDTTYEFPFMVMTLMTLSLFLSSFVHTLSVYLMLKLNLKFKKSSTLDFFPLSLSLYHFSIQRHRFSFTIFWYSLCGFAFDSHQFIACRCTSTGVICCAPATEWERIKKIATSLEKHTALQYDRNGIAMWNKASMICFLNELWNVSTKRWDKNRTTSRVSNKKPVP